MSRARRGGGPVALAAPALWLALTPALGAPASAAAPAPAEPAPPLAAVVAAMEEAAREDFAGTARVLAEKAIHPDTRKWLEESGEDPAETMAALGVGSSRRDLRWTFAGLAVRLEGSIEGEGSGARRVVYTFDHGVGILEQSGHATVRANRSQEFEVLGPPPFAFGRPFFRADAATRERLRAAMVDEGTVEEGGRRLRVLSYVDPWQPLSHRLWVDLAAGALAVREEVRFSTGGRELTRVVAIEETRRLADGRRLPVRIVEDLDYASGAGGIAWFPLSRRRVEVRDLVLAPQPPEAFHHELPDATDVDNEVLGIRYPAGRTRLPEAEVFRLATLPPVAPPAGESEAPGQPGSTGARQAPEESATPADVRCGLYALLAAAHLLGRPATLGALERASGFRQAGSNLEGLRQAAEAIGLAARGVRTDLGTVERQGWMGIAHLDGHHFVLLQGVGPEGVTVLDVPAPPRVWPHPEFVRRWPGVLLLLERREEPSP